MSIVFLTYFMNDFLYFSFGIWLIVSARRTIELQKADWTYLWVVSRPLLNVSPRPISIFMSSSRNSAIGAPFRFLRTRRVAVASSRWGVSLKLPMFATSVQENLRGSRWMPWQVWPLYDRHLCNIVLLYWYCRQIIVVYIMMGTHSGNGLLSMWVEKW